MHLPIQNISFDKLNSPLLTDKNITLAVARLDKIHPDVSGNKLFKLHYFVEECIHTDHKTMLSFGGAYSNHLVATAYLCKEKNLKAIGIVRGEQPKVLSHTLLKCKEYGMQLKFVSRKMYADTADNNFMQDLKRAFGNFTLVPEGGFALNGARGASLIQNIIAQENASHICTCVGTATTLAGLLMSNKPEKTIIAIPAIKNMTDINDRIALLTGNTKSKELEIFANYHFGGYARYNNELIQFMNDFYRAYNIPTDFIYTAKMMYAVMDQIKKNYFKPSSGIVCLHTGGLQGNLSLPVGTLIF